MRFTATRRALRALGRFAVFCLLTATLAQAQPATAPPAVLRLDDLLRDMHASNPALRAARLEAAAQATRPRQVSALPDPSVAVSYRPFAVDGLDGVIPPQVMVEQMIPYPGKRRLAAEVAAYGAEMAGYDADELLLELAYEVKTAYYELYRIQEQDRLIRQFQAQIGDFEEAAVARYEVGTGMQQAILKAQLERNALERRRLELAAERRMLLQRLARLTNQPRLAAAPDSLVVERPDIDVAARVNPTEALDARPGVKAIEAGLGMAEAEIERAKKEYRPDFMIGAGFMDMMAMDGSVAPLDDLDKRFGVSFGVVIPLQRGRRDAALEEARVRRSQYEARLEAIRTEIATEVNGLRNRLHEEEKALALYVNTLVPQAETTLEATLSAYTTGRTDFLDLLDAQRMLFDLHMDYEATAGAVRKTRAMLERALGVFPTGAAPLSLNPTGTPADASVQHR